MRKLVLGAALAVLFAGGVFAQCSTLVYNPITGQLDCSAAAGGSNVSATSAGAVTSLAVNVSTLNITSLDKALVQCFTGASSPFTPVTITSVATAGGPPLTTVTPSFSSTANVTCKVSSNGGVGPAGPTGATGSAGAAGAAGATGPAGPINQVADEGSNLPVQATVNFIGAGVTCANNVGSSRTDCTIPGSTSAGTVTSVNVAVPVEFSVSGVPFTTTGTATITKATQSANTFWMGPTSGGAAVPAFRAMVAADVPTSLNLSYQTLALTPLSDVITAAFRRNGSGQASNLVEFQTEGNVFLSGITKTGAFKQNGVTDGCATWATGVLGSTGTACGAGGGGGGVSASATFSSTATTGTLTHGFGSAVHVVQCINASNQVVIPTTVALGSASDVFGFTGGLAASTVCTATVGGGTGGGVTTLSGLAGVLTFVNDTNVTVTPSGSNLTLGFTGTLAKARQHAATFYTDQANTVTTGLQDFSAATHFRTPNAAGYTPTTNGHFGYDSTANRYLGYVSARVVTFGFTAGTRTAGKCLEFDANGDIVVAVSNAACGAGGGGGLSGLTTNTYPKAASSTTIADGHIVDDGSTGQVSTTKGFNAPAVVVTYSATPNFDLSLGNRFELTLTGNVSSSTFTNLKAGARGSIVYIQDATGGRTNVSPSGSANFCTISSTASVTTTQLYEVAANGTTVNGIGCTSTDTPTLFTGPTRSAPSNPAASNLACWFDSTDGIEKCKDSAGSTSSTVKSSATRTSNQYVTHNPTTGILATAQPAFTELSGTASIAQGGTGVATAPDDNILVGNGTTFVNTALTTCTGTGKAVTYDAATNAFGCNTIAAGTVATTSNALKGDNSGNAVAVTGTSSNCVHVDGSSAACGVSVIAATRGSSDTLNCSTTTAEQTFATTATIPSNTITTNSIVKISIAAEYTSTSSPSFTFKLKAGGTAIYTSTASVPTAATSNGVGGVFTIWGTTTPGASAATEIGVIAGGSSPVGTRNQVANTVNLATNGSLAVSATLTCSTATAGNSMILRSILIEQVQ
jgi:collagen type VII alpha